MMRVLRSSFPLIAVVALTTPTLVRAEPVEQRHTETPAQFLIDQRESLAEIRRQAPATPAREIASLIRLDIRNGDLTLAPIDVPAGDELNFSPDDDNASAFRLMTRSVQMQPPAVVVTAHLMRLDEANLRSINVDLVSMPGHFNFSMIVQTPAGTTDAQLLCETSDNQEGQPTSARMYIARSESADASDDAAINVSEINFASLVETHHDEALAMLGEPLTAMHSVHVLAGVAQAEAKLIFIANKPVNAAIEHELDAIVSTLREKGSSALPELRKRLRTLGSPAAMALSRRPRTGWSVDLGVNIDTLTADLFPGGAERAAALLKSPTRLIDLLYSHDIAVRRGAIEVLQTNPKFKLNFDVDADPYAHVAELEALRARIVPPTK